MPTLFLDENLPVKENNIMSKHTPGPWKAVNRGPFIATEENKVIARTVNATADPALNCQCQTVADLEQCANAELIAAAPDLYKALKGMIENYGPDMNSTHEQLQAMIAACNATAKARGEATL
jgi:hypothetical protein